MDASATATQAADAVRTPPAEVLSTGGRGSGRARGRGRGRSRGRGRGHGRGGGGGAGVHGAVEADAQAAVYAAAVDAAVPSTVTLTPTGEEMNGGGGGATVPPKRERKRGNDKKKKKPQEKPQSEATNGEKKEPPARTVVERTPLETLVHAVRIDDQALFNETLARHGNLQLNTLTKQGDAVLVEACRYARLDMVLKLAVDKRADVNVASMNDKGGRKHLRPIHAATMALRADIVQALFAAPDQRVDLSTMYDTALPATIAVFFCVANGYTEEQQTKALTILEAILDHAKVQGDHVLQQVLETETSRGGNRVIHIAVMLANYGAVEILKRFGADFSVPNAMGFSPLQLVEHNAFHRRSFTLSRLPLRSDKSLAKKKPSRKKKGKDEKEDAPENESEPESAAEIEVKGNHSVKRLDRELENLAVLKTLLPLIDLFGLGPVFSRKGSEGIRSIHVKGLVLAHEGIPFVTNKIFALPKDDPKKPVYVDGVLHCVTCLHGLSLKNNSQFAKLWKQAFLEPVANNGDPGETLHESTLAQILDALLDHKSLSRRVKVWTMIVVKTLDCYDRDGPVSAQDHSTLARVPLSIVGPQTPVFASIAEAIYRSGCKMLFSIFDRSEVDEDESYDEELEFHILLALVEMFFQLYVPFCQVQAEDASTISTRFQEITAPIQRLWSLLETALSSLDETVATPQRFSLVLHTLQVFEVVSHALENRSEYAVAVLFKTLKQFAKQELSKKRFVHDTLKRVQLLHSISELFALPQSLLDRVGRIKEPLDLLLRSDAKILGLDLYAFARHDGIVRLEHKVEYLEVLSEEQSGGIHITISRASNANYVDFILQQILSTSSSKLKGELDIGLVDEPGVGAGVVREFFQIIQHTFFSPQPLNIETMAASAASTTEAPPAHVSDIGSQWLQLARNSPFRVTGPDKKAKRANIHAGGDVLRFFPLFQHADDTNRRLRITPRKLRVAAAVADQKQQDKSLHLTQQDLLVNDHETTTLKQLYLCAGRLLGLAIRDQQPLDAFFPLAFWKFMTFEKVSWEDYCEGNDVFKRSLQFVLDHDFEAEPLDMRFEFTADVEVVSSNQEAPPSTVAMEVELAGTTTSGTVVTNANKGLYVELRAKQFFFGNEFEYYKKMRDGLGEAVRKVDLKLFLPSELQRVVRGDREIDVDGLKKSVIYSRGITEAHEVVRHFWEVVETFDQPMKEKLLTFWSGSALPPLFGFHSHNRMNPHSAYWYFDLEPASKSGELCPTANTCDRRLMVPQYPTKDALQEKLLVALEHGAVGYDRM